MIKKIISVMLITLSIVTGTSEATNAFCVSTSIAYGPGPVLLAKIIGIIISIIR